MNLSRKWKVMLIHHSHTDIGYTERQEKIALYHADFIRQAVGILNRAESGVGQLRGFRWQCENFWQVENFLNNATESEKADFLRYVKSGDIGLSGNYLNMTELVDSGVLKTRIAKAEAFGKSIGQSISSGMCADINGLAWGYADALYEGGVYNMFSCLHSHHGMFPLYKKLTPFYWESPKGRKILVWNGEHYHFGNEMLFSPRASCAYLLNDDVSARLRSGLEFCKNAEDTEATELEFLGLRLERYLKNLEDEEYPYGFVPFMVSGGITDNSPPNELIADRVNRLNAMYEGEVSFEMVTLDSFFAELRKSDSPIPTYRGDWNDWWADGVGSTPAAVKIYRSAQRKYNTAKKLDRDGRLGNKTLDERAAHDLMLYAEHTWGYSSSVSEPWESFVGELEHKKSAFAVNADTAASANLDVICQKLGETGLACNRTQRFRVINPHDRRVETTAYLIVSYWEFIEGVAFGYANPFEVIDASDGSAVRAQMKNTARAYQIEIEVSLEAGQRKDFYLRRAEEKRYNPTMISRVSVAADGVWDIAGNNPPENSTEIETRYFYLRFDRERGVAELINRVTGEGLIRKDAPYPLFAGVYEVTAAGDNQCGKRRSMGRNRKAIDTERYASRVRDVRVTENGPVYITAELDCALNGTGMYTVFLKIYKNLPKITVKIRIQKDCVRDPENLYVSLPLTSGGKGENGSAAEECYIDKTGCIMRPGIDQLPGTNKEFYLLQNGVFYKGGSASLMIAVKDAPLVVFGGLEAAPIKLCDGHNDEMAGQPLYSWLMNNFWETNFKVDLGGFYEFEYTLMTGGRTDAAEAFERIREENEGLVSFNIE